MTAASSCLATTLPCVDAAPIFSLFASLARAADVKWLESGGARVVPIRFDSPPAATSALLASLNGAVLTGGAAAFFEADGSLTRYAATAQLIIAESQRAARAGESWPVWGTCLGHELALVLAAGPNSSVLTGNFDAEDLPLALTAAPAAATSRLWGSAPPEVWQWLTTENITENLHTQGITPEDFEGSSLAGTVDILTTNVDRNGRPFVSSAEAREWPLYVVQ